MLGRPNPYRKTRAKGTIDDLMFDMDKRRHTSFRFQNYQNFITDRPGKLDERYRQKLSWCALDEETGKLDYLTEGGLSPNNGRRMSTSSVGSRSQGGDRDSLLPTWDALKSNASEGGSKSGDGADDDCISSSVREDAAGASPAASSSGRGLGVRTPPPYGSGRDSPSSALDDGSGSAGRYTPGNKPSSGRSWVTPKFVMDSENRTPSTLREGFASRSERFQPPSSLPEHSVSVPNDGHVMSVSLSPPRSRYNMHQALTASSVGNGTSSSGTLSGGRRSPFSPRSRGTNPARLSGSLPARSNDDSSLPATSALRGQAVTPVGKQPAEASGVKGAGGGLSSPPEDDGLVSPPPPPPPPLAFCGDSSYGGSVGEVGDARESAESGRRNEGVFDSAAESVAVMGSDGSQVAGETAAALNTSRKSNEMVRMIPPRDRNSTAGVLGTGVADGGGSGIGSGKGSGGSGGSGSGGGGAGCGRRASYGTISQNLFSTADSGIENTYGGSGDYPRPSETSTYFSSTTSTVAAPDFFSSSRGSLVAGPGAASSSSGRGSGDTVGGGDTIGSGDTVGSDRAGVASSAAGPGDSAGGRDGSGGTVESVGVAADDPGKDVNEHVPRVGAGKLKHDKEQSRDVAANLEAVAAELGKSLVARGFGTAGAATAVPTETNPASAAAVGGDGGRPERLELDEAEKLERQTSQPGSSQDVGAVSPRLDAGPAASAATPGVSSKALAREVKPLSTPKVDPKLAGAKRTNDKKGEGAEERIKREVDAAAPPGVAARTPASPAAPSETVAAVRTKKGPSTPSDEKRRHGNNRGTRGKDCSGHLSRSEKSTRVATGKVEKGAAAAAAVAALAGRTASSRAIQQASSSPGGNAATAAAKPILGSPSRVAVSMMLPPPARGHQPAAPPSPSFAMSSVPAAHGGGSNPSTPVESRPNCTPRFGNGTPRMSVTPQRLHHNMQKAAAAGSGHGGKDRGRGREKGRDSRGSRGSSAPPMEGARVAAPGIDGIGAGIVSSSDLVTSVQVMAHDAPPLSGVPHNPNSSTPTVANPTSPRTFFGGGSGSNTGTSAKSPLRRGAETPRKGKYQVKDSFNRLRGWINGGFATGGNRRNNGSNSPTPKTPSKRTPTANPKGKVFAERVIADGDKANSALTSAGSRTRATAADGASADAKTSSSSSNRRNSVGKSTRLRGVPHNAADRAANREALKAGGAAAAAARKAGTGAPAATAAAAGGGGGSRPKMAARSNKTGSSGYNPPVRLNPGGGGGGSGGCNGSGGVTPRATRDTSPSSSFATLTPTHTALITPPPSGPSITGTPSQERQDGWMSSAGSRSVQPSPGKQQLHAEPGPAGKAVASEGGGGSTVPSRTKTTKVAKSLGATVPALSPSSRLAKGGGRPRGSVETSNGRAVGTGTGKRRSVRGSGGGGSTVAGSSNPQKQQQQQRIVSPSAAPMKSPKRLMSKGKRVVEPSPVPSYSPRRLSSSSSPRASSSTYSPRVSVKLAGGTTGSLVSPKKR